MAERPICSTSRETLDADHVRLRIVHVLTVPMTVPIDVSMLEAERRADTLLRRSREIAERFDVLVETAALRGREVGVCLAEEARRTQADAIVRPVSQSAPLPCGIRSSTRQIRRRPDCYQRAGPLGWERRYSVRS